METTKVEVDEKHCFADSWMPAKMRRFRVGHVCACCCVLVLGIVSTFLLARAAATARDCVRGVGARAAGNGARPGARAVCGAIRSH
eukprot:6205614-Pleurochrysis_carterae.AAC.1